MRKRYWHFFNHAFWHFRLWLQIAFICRCFLHYASTGIWLWHHNTGTASWGSDGAGVIGAS